MDNRDMMYGGYNVNMPGNYSYGNFGFQGPPGSIPMMNGYYDYNQGNMNNNLINTLASRINSLETRIKNLEHKLNNMSNNSSNSYQEDNSIYML